MERIERIQKSARKTLPWLPKYFTVTDVTEEYVTGWVKTSQEVMLLRHLCEKHTKCNYISRYVHRLAQKAKLMNRQQRIYLSLSSVPVNKHPFLLNKVNIYTCMHKDTGNVKIPDYKRKKRLRINVRKKVDCPARIIVKHLTIFEGYCIPKNLSFNEKRNIIKEIKSQLEIDPSIIPSTNWSFVKLPLASAHRLHDIPTDSCVSSKEASCSTDTKVMDKHAINICDNIIDSTYNNKSNNITSPLSIEESLHQLLKKDERQLILSSLKENDFFLYTDTEMNNEDDNTPIIIKTTMSSNINYDLHYDISEGSIKVENIDDNLTKPEIIEISESSLDLASSNKKPPVIPVSLNDLKKNALRKDSKLSAQSSKCSREKGRLKNLRLSCMNIDASISLLQRLKKDLPTYFKQNSLEDDGANVVSKLASCRSTLSDLHSTVQDIEVNYVNENQKLQEEYFKKLKLLQKLTRKRFTERDNKIRFHQAVSQKAEELNLSDYVFT